MPKKKSKKTISPQKKNVMQTLPDIVPVYSNSVHLRTSNYDIRFSFGEILEAGEKGTVTLERARVYMTVEHSKAFLHALRDNIEKYEKMFGKVKFPVNPKS